MLSLEHQFPQSEEQCPSGMDVASPDSLNNSYYWARQVTAFGKYLTKKSEGQSIT